MKRSKPPMTRRIACIRAPNLAIQAVLRERFRPTERVSIALALTAPSPKHAANGQQIITAVNELASECGVRIGSSLAAARGACPELIAVTDNPARTAEALHSLADSLGRFGPLVSLCKPDAVFVDTTGVLAHTPNKNKLSEGYGVDVTVSALTKVLDELELHGAASIATTPFRARALVSDEALKRKTVNPAPTPTNEVKEVERLGLHAAGLPPKAFRALDVVGIRTIGAFMALPSSSLARRFGHEVYTLWRQAHDLERWPLPPHSPEKMLQETYRCDEAMHGLDPLCFCIKMLLDRALSRLNGRGQGIETLSLEFTLDTAYEALDPDPEQLSLLTGGSSTVLRRPERTHRITLSLGHPKQDSVLLLQLIRSRLNQHSPSGPVIMVSLQIEQATSLKPRQLDLFGDPEPLETIQTTMARLAAALGVQCFIPRLREDYRPERAWEMSTLEQKPPAAAPPPGPRPTRLLRTPTPLNRFGDDHEPPGALKGPERLVTGWWDSDPIARDYWVISDRWGRRSWVFRDIATSSWFLHGYFD